MSLLLTLKGPIRQDVLVALVESLTVRQVLPLRKVRRRHRSLTGDKSWVAARLLQLGFNVPDGFCILAHADLTDAAVSHAIREQYARLGRPRVAVRSSALSEDGATSSAAGQYETYLGVAGEEALLQAIRDCMASGRAASVQAYHAALGGVEQGGVGVLVMPMVSATAAGVAFTAHPTSGERDRIVVEAVRGAGPTLVDGRARPLHVVLSRPSLHLISLDRPQQQTSLVVSHEGLEERPLNDAQTRQPALSLAQVREVATAALHIEKALNGVPQDVEFAWEGDTLWILQARPITALPPPPAIWSTANTGEVVPDVITPMTWSIVSLFLDGLVARSIGPFGVDRLPWKPYARFNGRVYFNISALDAFLSQFPVISHLGVDRILGGHQAGVSLQRQISLKFSWDTLRGLAGLLRTRPPVGDIVPELLRENETVVKPVMQSPTRQNIAHLCRTAFSEDAILKTASAVLPYFALFFLCRVWHGDQDGALVHRLMAGMGDMASAAPMEEMIELAARIPVSNTAGDTWDEVLATWTPEHAELMRSFLSRHGHHARGELELANARWSETPGPILAALKAARAEREVALSRIERRDRERHAAEKECLARLGAARRGVWQTVLAQARDGIRLRENIKSIMVQRLAMVRQGLLKLGAQEGLERPDDIFFLDWRELEAWPDDAQELIRQRRAEYEAWQNAPHPPVIVGSTPIFDADPGTDGRTWKGLGVSPGIAEGPARVIVTLNADVTVEPGDILVVPFTDPGWTPLFVAAAGIVMDMGGLLTHGGIVAREMGLPAVVNVGDATKRIQTGTRLRVDGHAGRVDVLD